MSLHAIVSRLVPALAALAFCATVQAQDMRLHALLSGDGVVSATDSPATGEASGVLDDDGTFRFDLVYGRLESNVTGASLHTGKSTENGPEVAALDVRGNQTSGALTGEVLTLDPSVAKRMRDGETYLLVTTVDHPDGAIRGQLLPQPVRLEDEPEEE